MGPSPGATWQALTEVESLEWNQSVYAHRQSNPYFSDLLSRTDRLRQA
jgi:hypothetical protein